MHLQKSYLNTRAIASHTNTSASFLNQRRVSGDGPPFIKLGSRVLYDLDVVETWLNERARRSTSEVAG